MTETQRRIRAYKQALPRLREKVAAVAMLLAMSVAMMTAASFAWLSLSVKPEVTGASTTVAANGNLEIALVPRNGEKPDESAVGDSALDLWQRNVTWGNLINLSDPKYGLDNLNLRPAQLNLIGLSNRPLYGAEYGSDGRITKLNPNFGYTIWNEPADGKPGYFGVSEEYGVRAISSTKIEAVGADKKYGEMIADAENKNLTAGNIYRDLTDNKSYMSSLATLMGTYMTARMNPSDEKLKNPTCEIADIQNLRDMYSGFLDAFDAEAEAMAAILNLQLFLLNGEGNYEPYTGEDIYSLTSANLSTAGLTLSKLSTFVKDHTTIESDLEKLNALCAAGGTITWVDSGMNNIVNNLVNVGTCTLDGTPISSIGASNAMGYISGTHDAVITNGILWNFEERCGEHIYVKGMSITATISRSGFTVPGTVKANISTSAPESYNLFNTDLQYAQSLNDGNFKGGIAVAEDTYGLAIDLWVRTNATGSFLTLEGNVLIETKAVPLTGKDASGNTVDLYSFTSTGDDGEEYEIEVYQKDGSWYLAASHEEVSKEQLGGATPVQKFTEVEEVLGYQGENRVWEESSFLSVNSTTQGSGSCYVYYADTPEDQARSLKLLEAMNVVFISEEGKLLASAEMDTKHYFAENGRVTVPLILRSDSLNLGEDYEGNAQLAITALEQNVPMRITAVVYLDGRVLNNEEVLAAADIQGQLNIQFGSSEKLLHAEDEKLSLQERSISAEVDKTLFNYDEASETNPMTTTVTLTIEGDAPKTVTAFFLRAINATQGSREETMIFTKDDDGKWVSSYTFTTPGNYVLRTIRLDGVDYSLTECPTVTVEGFTIASLSCLESDANNHVTIMTADPSREVNVRMKFVTHDINKMPKAVQGRYMKEDGTVATINFQYDPTSQEWSGKANFVFSGEYTLQYVVLDGEYVELDAEFWQTATVCLGMKVAVYTTSPQRFKFVPSEMTEEMKNLGMKVVIMDNTGAEMQGLSGAQLTYAMKGSGTKSMNTDLKWNAASGYYEGSLRTEFVGIFQFREVIVGENEITTSTTAPVFTILSPEPPEYYGHNTTTYQYSPNQTAVMNVQLSNSASASVKAIIVNEKTGAEHDVIGVIGGDFTSSEGKAVNHWNFTVPKEAEKQDGYWRLKQIEIWDAYDANGNPYTEEAPLKIDLLTESITTKVVTYFNVVFVEDKSRDFGKDAAGNITGYFMDAHTISGLSVQVQDFAGEAIPGINNAALTFTYMDGTSSRYGGYSSQSLTSASDGAMIIVSLENSGDQMTFNQTADQTIRFAGEYATKLSFNINAGGAVYTYTVEGNTLPARAPKFTVSSKVPVVKFTGVDPTGTFKGADAAGKNEISNLQNKFTDYTLECYFKASSNCKSYTASKATTTLSDAGNSYTSATCVIVSNGTASDVIFTYTPGDPSDTQDIGKYSSSTRTYIGTDAMAKELKITYNEVEYTVTLKNPLKATCTH